jgi:hypothetical protein
MTQHHKIEKKKKIITDSHTPHQKTKKQKLLLQLAREKDRETLTNTIKQSTQQKGKKEQRHRVGARKEVRGRRTITWRATRFGTGPRIDCLLADDDCGACDRVSV